MKPVIVGAGPIGSYTAKLLKELNPIVIDQRKKIGKPVQCTGLVSTRLRTITKYPKNIIMQKIKGAEFFSENNHLILKAKRVMAHVIDRAKYDQWMNKEVKTSLSEKFINYEKGVVKTSKRSIKTDLLIDCSGPKNGLLGVQAVTKLKHVKDMVELHFNIVQDFFAWVVPADNGYCRVGLASKNKPMPVLKQFLKKVGAGRVKEWNAGIIPITINEFYDNNYIAIGDAAGQVKALSGGGLVTGLQSAEIAAQAVLKGGRSKKFFRREYYKPWSKTIGRELWIHQKIRNYLNQCNYDELLNFLNKNKSIIEQYGDMDYLSKFIFRLMKPSNWSFLLKAGWQLITS